MSSPILEDHEKIASAARDWVGLLFAGEPSEQDQARFQTWIAQSPAHRDAFETAKESWTLLGLSDRVEEWVNSVEPVVERNAARRFTRRTWLAAGLAASAAAVAFVAIPRLIEGMKAAQPVTYASGIAETRSFQLDDGSVVTLGGASAVSVAYTSTQRDVHLLRGSAFFDVQHEENRPFVVQAASSEVVVLGTAFGVRIGDDVSVAVARGVVSVAGPKDGAASRARLEAGQRLVAGLDGSIVSSGPADLSSDLSWIEGYLTYNGALLSDVVADINRYRVRQVTVEGRDVETLRITASFRADQTDQFLAGLSSAYPVTVTESPGATFIRPRPVN